MTPEMIPDIQQLYRVTEATWPPERLWQQEGITLRDGAGGGKRVSAATCDDVPSAQVLTRAEGAMRDLGQAPLFMIREGEAALDHMLESQGYRIIDPVTLYRLPVAALTDKPIPPVTAFSIWEPLAIMKELWAQDGIGPERLAVMGRAKQKTSLLARWNEQPAGAAFVGLHAGVAMVHAVIVTPQQRRQGVAQWMMRKAAFWTEAQGAQWLSVLCVTENIAANRLYQGLGFEAVGSYHYRIKEKT